MNLIKKAFGYLHCQLAFFFYIIKFSYFPLIKFNISSGFNLHSYLSTTENTFLSFSRLMYKCFIGFFISIGEHPPLIYPVYLFISFMPSFQHLLFACNLCSLFKFNSSLTGITNTCNSLEFPCTTNVLNTYTDILAKFVCKQIPH